MLGKQISVLVLFVCGIKLKILNSSVKIHFHEIHDLKNSESPVIGLPQGGQSGGIVILGCFA